MPRGLSLFALYVPTRYTLAIPPADQRVVSRTTYTKVQRSLYAKRGLRFAVFSARCRARELSVMPWLPAVCRGVWQTPVRSRPPASSSRPYNNSRALPRSGSHLAGAHTVGWRDGRG